MLPTGQSAAGETTTPAQPKCLEAIPEGRSLVAVKDRRWVAPPTRNLVEEDPSEEEVGVPGPSFVTALARVFDQLVRFAGPPRRMTRFHAVRAPMLSLHDYLARLETYFACSESCFVLALIYIDRIVKMREQQVCSLNIHRLLATSLMVSAKFLDDVYYSNAYYSKVAGVRPQECNMLETTFIKLLDWRLHVTPAEYEQYRKHVLVAVHGTTASSSVPQHTGEDAAPHSAPVPPSTGQSQAQRPPQSNVASESREARFAPQRRPPGAPELPAGRPAAAGQRPAPGVAQVPGMQQHQNQQHHPQAMFKHSELQPLSKQQQLAWEHQQRQQQQLWQQQQNYHRQQFQQYQSRVQHSGGEAGHEQCQQHQLHQHSALQQQQLVQQRQQRQQQHFQLQAQHRPQSSRTADVKVQATGQPEVGSACTGHPCHISTPSTASSYGLGSATSVLGSGTSDGLFEQEGDVSTAVAIASSSPPRDDEMA